VLLACVTLAASELFASVPPSSLETQIDSYVQPYVDGNNFSGSILIARQGKILLNKGYGMADYELSVPNTPQTRFHLASLSKSFTAAAIMILEDQGKLSVQDPLKKFIPDYPNGDRITIHHLLTHHSGIPNVNNFPEYATKSLSPMSLDEIIRMFKDKPLEFEPGARYRYSNSNYNLLAFIIEKVSGKRYGDFLGQFIFGPLGMKDTGNDDGLDALISGRASGYVPVGASGIQNAPYLNWSAKTGNGSLYSTTEDLYKWDRALYTEKILTKRSLDRIFTDYDGWGYGWSVRKHFGRPVTVITGRSPGFTSSLERFIADDVCIIVAGNNYSGVSQAMADDLAAIVFGEKYEAPQRVTHLSPSALASYTGKYQFGEDFTYNPGAAVTVEQRGDELVMENGADNTFLLPQSDTRFLDRLYGGTVTFVRGADGQVTRLTWNFGRDFVAQKLPAR
jgi:CubicO group peptidase (beta-lactamase class C family)